MRLKTLPTAMVLCAATGFVAPAAAQSKRVIPASATTRDANSSSAYPFGYTTGRTQQILEGSFVCNTLAIVNGLSLRADGNATAMAGRTVKSLKFSVGITSKTPSTMSATFAQNRTGTQTQILSGSYSLPSQTATARSFNITFKFAKPYIYMRKSGNLLFEIEVPGTPGKSSYFVDAYAPSSTGGGRAWAFGQQGKFSSGDTLNPLGLNPANLKPGGSAAYMINGMKSQYPAIVVWGLSNRASGGLSLPIDLTQAGAPGNKLYVSTDLTLPLPITAGRGGWEGRSTLPIPTDPKLAGFSGHVQSLFVDRASNALGLVFSQGLTMRLAGGPKEMRRLGHWSATNATGFLGAVGGGVVCQLTGTFN